MFEHSLDGAVMHDRQGTVVAVNAAMEKITGYSAGELQRMSISDLCVPERVGEAKACLDRVMGGEALGVETAIIRKDGRRLAVFVTATPLMVEGRIVGDLAILRDISQHKLLVEELRQSEERYRGTAEANARLVQEIDHRVRNNLAELVSLIDLTRRGAPDLDSFAAALRDRVRAMAQTHTVLSASHWGDVDLRWLVERLLEGLRLGVANAIPVTVEGPSVTLTARQAHTVSLTLCELFSNSCRHGAHRSAGGKLRITWALTADQQVALRWQESGGPAVRAPGTLGLGTKLIRGFVEYDLRGRCTLRFPPQGVDHCLVFTAAGGAGAPGEAAAI
jgi:PAS domain S-box-containing protein